MRHSKLIKIRGLIRRYASLISAADRMEWVDFEPKFCECVRDVHAIIQHLPASFISEQSDLVGELQKESYHFSWSALEDRLSALIDSTNEC